MMTLRGLGLSLGLVAVMSLASARAASAVTILVFGQNGIANTVTATTDGTTTTITGTDIAVTLTAIENAADGTQAFLDFTFVSDSAASTNGGNIDQSFQGTFSFNSLANNAGINYLSGDFDDLATGAQGGNQLTVGAGTPTDIINFSSDVITSLDLERALSIAFTNLTPGLAICGTSLCGFEASIAGNFSGNIGAVVPEPVSMLLFGAGLLGFAVHRRRRS